MNHEQGFEQGAWSGRVGMLYERWLELHASDSSETFEAFLRANPGQAEELRGIHEHYLRLGSMLCRQGLPSPGGGVAPEARRLPEVAFWAEAGHRRLEDQFPGLLAGLETRRNRYDRFRLVEGDEGRLGEGGMGRVLRAWDSELEREVAIKIVKQGPARFLREARVIARLDHPGIVPIHELGVDSAGRLYYAMRCIEGSTLQEVLQSRKGAGGREWSDSRILAILQRVAQTLAFAHERGIVHRDLKPANIMLGRFGEAYVVDWGLAHASGDPRSTDDLTGAPECESDTERLTREGQVLGTLLYMAPEQAYGSVTEVLPASDIYSLGAILYELLTGSPPYADTLDPRTPPAERTAKLIAAVRQGQPKQIDRFEHRVSPELIAICQKAMAKSPRDRYADMAHFADDLGAFLEGGVVLALPPNWWSRGKKWVRRNRALSIALMISMLLASTSVSLLVAKRVEAARRLSLESTEYADALVDRLRRFPEGDALADATSLERAVEYHAMLAGEGIEISAADPLSAFPLRPRDHSRVESALLDVLIHQASMLYHLGGYLESFDLPPTWSPAADQRSWAIAKQEHPELRLDWAAVTAFIDGHEARPWRRLLWHTWKAWVCERKDEIDPLLHSLQNEDLSGEDVEWLAEIVNDVRGIDFSMPLYRLALERDPERLWSHIRLSIREYGLHRARHMVPILESRQSMVAWYNFAQSLQSQAMTLDDLIIASQERAMAIAPDRPEPYANLALAIGGNEGLLLLEHYTDRYGPVEQVLEQLTAIACDLHCTDALRPYAEEAAARFPNNDRIAYHLGRLYLQEGRYADGLVQSEWAAKLHGASSWYAHTDAGFALQKIVGDGKTEADEKLLDLAREHYSQAAYEDPGAPTSNFNMAAICLCEGRFVESLDYFQSALDLDPNCPRVGAGLEQMKAYVLGTQQGLDLLPRIEELMERTR